MVFLHPSNLKKICVQTIKYLKVPTADITATLKVLRNFNINFILEVTALFTFVCLFVCALVVNSLCTHIRWETSRNVSS